MWHRAITLGQHHLGTITRRPQSCLTPRLCLQKLVSITTAKCARLHMASASVGPHEGGGESRHQQWGRETSHSPTRASSVVQMVPLDRQHLCPAATCHRSSAGSPGYGTFAHCPCGRESTAKDASVCATLMRHRWGVRKLHGLAEMGTCHLCVAHPAEYPSHRYSQYVRI